MLETIEYLQSGKTFDDLTNELAIKVTRHNTLPLAILNYNQIDSPKTHPVVRECRSLVLNTQDYGLVSRSFPRFFNWGEVEEEMKLFDWSTCQATVKVDGSLIQFFYFDNAWHVITRSTFADLPIFNNEWDAKYHNLPMTFTWKDAICKALDIDDLQEIDKYLFRDVTYVCELCTPWNRVVQKHNVPYVYAITSFDGEEEIGPWKVCAPFEPIQNIFLRSPEEITKFVNEYAEATFEGVVVKDDNDRRWKIKNARYLALASMKGNNGENLYKPDNLVPFILSGEGDEMISIFPEVKECFSIYKIKVEEAYCQLEKLWYDNYQIENQKDFALKIVGKTPFTAILFNLRKVHGKNQTPDLLKSTWRGYTDGIVKILFK